MCIQTVYVCMISVRKCIINVYMFVFINITDILVIEVSNIS